MSGQPRLVSVVAFLLLLLSILVISKTDAAAQSLMRTRGLKLATSLGEMEKGSSSLQTVKRSGPSSSGPGHKFSEASTQGYPMLRSAHGRGT
ncbi:hypothetical protein DITRI_Ditri08aG0106300 [Diplodiscus trichospermus]